MNNSTSITLFKTTTGIKLRKIFLIFVSSASLASAQILLTGGDPSGGVTLDPNTVMTAIYTPVNQDTNFFLQGEQTVFQGVIFSAALDPNVVLPVNSSYVHPLAPDTSANTGFTNASPTTEDNNLLNLMNAGITYSTTPLTLTINNLTPFTSYKIDSFLSLLGYTGRTDSVSYNGGAITQSVTFANDDVGSHSIYVLEDTVEADSLGSIQVTYSGSDDGPFYNAMVVSTISPTIPEPSTYALLLAGLAFLGFCLRRKSARFHV